MYNAVHSPLSRRAPAARSARRFGSGARPRARLAEKIARELGERQLIHLALELHYRVERHPVVVPAPGVELGLGRGAQAHVAVAPDQPQQEPDLFLAAVVSAPIALEPLRRHLVAQPVARAAEDLDVTRQQAHFLAQLAVHRLHRRLAVLDAALRELPGMLAYPLAPEHLVAPVAQDDADVRAIAVSIEHVGSSKNTLAPIVPQFGGDLKAREYPKALCHKSFA